MGRAFQNRKESMAKTSDQNARVYSRHSREIYVVAKQGGPEPDSNLALRSAIDRAKRAQVPTHVIDKAIDKAKGGAGEDFQPARYEGFGPAGSMFIVDCLTDNPNRTISDVRNCFTKSNSKLGTPGTVAHLFDHLAIMRFAGQDEEAVLEALLMADIDVTDVEDEDGKITVFVPPAESNKTEQALKDAFGELEFEVNEIQFIPQNAVQISGEEDQQMFERLTSMLDDVDDVQNVYHNVNA
jgi:YebC/PmpR family DNA-binding regulatory protein